MLGSLVIFLFVFILVVAFGYFGHRALHKPWMKRFNKSHMVHHIELYPPKKLTSEKYLSAGKDSTTWIFLILSLPLLLLPWILWLTNLISLTTAVCVVLEMLFVGWLHDYIHNAFHIENHYLNNLPLFGSVFQRWKHLHFIHHRKMQRNLGIFNFYFDKKFKTFVDK